MNQSPENVSDVSSKNSIEIIDIQRKQNSCAYHFPSVTKNPINFVNNQRYIDESFPLKPSKDQAIQINRLSLVYPPNTPLFIDLKSGHQLDRPTKQKVNASQPSYLSQINILPFSHYCKLIEPAFVNDQGYYQVTVLKDGVLVKQLIDDTFYFDSRTNQIITHPQLSSHPWVHIVIKVWAKLNHGYQNLDKCLPFQFIKAFSFPDWQLINPKKQKKQALIKRLTRASNKTQYVIAKTRNNQKVRYFGFTPNCASFVINGHYQQYADIYVKLTSFTHDRWNNFKSSNQTKSPQQMPALQQNQFLMPLNQFENIFHLIYSTSNKYNPHIKKSDIPSQLHFEAKLHSITYNKFTLNVDARETNAIVVGLDIQTANDDYKFVQVGLCLYFPPLKVFDLVRNDQTKNEHELGRMVVPWCKLMIGRMHETTNLQASYMEVVKEKMLDCGEDLISFVTHTSQHDFVAGSYFKGYANQLTHNLVLKTGKYLLRIKIEQKIAEYRCFINTTAVNGRAKIFDPHVQQKQQVTLLEDCLYKKAARDRQCITFINPAKKGSWISCRDEYNILGYSYVAVHVVKNADNKIVVSINPKKLKENGYIVKGHKDLKEYTIVVDSQENTLIVIKYDKQWNKAPKRIWPPPGIEFNRVRRIKNQ